MKSTSRSRTVPALLVAAALAACGTAPREPAPRAVQPGAPGEPTRPAPAAPAAAPDPPAYTEADVRFIRGMIAHHQQALEMSALVPSRTDREDVRLLARRIEIAQREEIGMMERWLRKHGEEVPGPHEHHGEGEARMPGMLSAEELDRLAAARGAGFDRLFLVSMIRHHQGALEMVEELFDRRGAGQQSEVFQLAAEIAGDQRIEIDRMLRMLSPGP